MTDSPKTSAPGPARFDEPVASRRGLLTGWLEGVGPVTFSAFAIASAFSTYFSMYAFRKPFAQGTFEGELALGGLELDYKIALIISQVLGYCLSKFIGIKVISEASAARRGRTILGLIAFAELSLVGFALALINTALDEIGNPRLRSEAAFLAALGQRAIRPDDPTPVRRDLAPKKPTKSKEAA